MKLEDLPKGNRNAGLIKVVNGRGGRLHSRRMKRRRASAVGYTGLGPVATQPLVEAPGLG